MSSRALAVREPVRAAVADPADHHLRRRDSTAQTSVHDGTRARSAPSTAPARRPRGPRDGAASATFGGRRPAVAAAAAAAAARRAGRARRRDPVAHHRARRRRRVSRSSYGILVAVVGAPLLGDRGGHAEVRAPAAARGAPRTPRRSGRRRHGAAQAGQLLMSTSSAGRRWPASTRRMRSVAVVGAVRERPVGALEPAPQRRSRSSARRASVVAGSAATGPRDELERGLQQPHGQACARRRGRASSASIAAPAARRSASPGRRPSRQRDPRELRLVVGARGRGHARRRRRARRRGRRTPARQRASPNAAVVNVGSVRATISYQRRGALRLARGSAATPSASLGASSPGTAR